MKKNLVILLITLFCLSSFAQDSKKEKKGDAKNTFAEVTGNLSRIEGFLPLYYNAEQDKLYFEVDKLDKEFLYQISLSTGIGSNPIGLDRGQLGETRVVKFEKVGNKLMLNQPNYGFRANSKNVAEQRAVRDSFASSIIWGFKIVAEESGKYLVDATDFLLRDAHGVSARLARAKQGNYSIDLSRSAFYMPLVKGFPKNTEIETMITLTAKGETGRLINDTVPTGDSVSVRQRHSFVELPDDGYTPRKFDPRIGVNGLSFFDYATDIGEPLERRIIVRHRLKKKNPNSEVSEAVAPIVYYVDNGAPKKIRDALIEGASWWNQAFEAAGYKNAFQVKALPPDADPMDIRYNVINWVHRSTRGWAYGSSVVDPRTGEIIRGVVTLDSQRARQDYLIASGLDPQFASECELSTVSDLDYLLQPGSNTNADSLAVARIKQLSAHEVGHTLGFSHNFAASTYGRGSVMDYPAPLIEIKNGELDFSNAYAVGIGVYDKWAVQFAYSDFPAGTDESAALENIIERGVANGYLFITDADTRPASAAQPLSSLWDNGADPVGELSKVLAVRKIGIKNFGINNIRNGDSLSELQTKFLPLYLYHRYQTTAATKSIGGVYYSYSVREGEKGNPEKVFEIVPAEKQRVAIKAVLETISPEALEIPTSILRIMPPHAFGSGSVRREDFPSRTNPVFDPYGVAEMAADMTVAGLLEPNRATRMINFHAQDSRYPNFDEVTNALINAGWAPRSSVRYAETRRAVQTSIVNGLMNLAANSFASVHSRAIANSALKKIQTRLRAERNDDFSQMLNQEIERFLSRSAPNTENQKSLETPPGDPIG
ncbi:MAG: zinc-dependent metalloprotease [Pyrinomonadaceae bacterium]